MVTVALPVYNGARELAQAIDSVLAQTYSDVELLVVDDGSTDGTWELLQTYGDRIHSIRQKNAGLAAARNAALRQARGEFVALMDHDDICAPERLAIQVALMRAHPEIGLCCSDFGAFDSTGPIADSYIGQYYSSCAPELGGPLSKYAKADTLEIASYLPAPRPATESVKVAFGNVYDAMAHGNFAHPPTVMVRASVLQVAGGFDPEARSATDWDWLVRVARVTQFGYVERPLLQYRRSDTQMSSHKPRDSLDGLHVYQRSCARDPELVRRNRASLRGQVARASIDAAYSNAELRPWLAMRLLADATLRYGVVNGMSRRALTKALVPNQLLDWIRRRRPING
ncbi:MAG: glycosyltransferase [Burkholderiaceae bacterium]